MSRRRTSSQSTRALAAQTAHDRYHPRQSENGDEQRFRHSASTAALHDNAELGDPTYLASNISIGRDWAGVHFFSDYYESILMGEEIAIAILEEQKLTFGENFSMTLPKFDGTTIRI